MTTSSAQRWCCRFACSASPKTNTERRTLLIRRWKNTMSREVTKVLPHSSAKAGWHEHGPAAPIAFSSHSPHDFLDCWPRALRKGAKWCKLKEKHPFLSFHKASFDPGAQGSKVCAYVQRHTHPVCTFLQYEW